MSSSERGKVIRPAVLQWMAVPPEERFTFESRLHATLGPLPPGARQALEGATYPQLAAWERRFSYGCSPAEIFDPHWKLPLQGLSWRDMVAAALHGPLRCWAITFRFKRSRSLAADRRVLFDHVPWLIDLPNPWKTIGELRESSWTLLTSDHETLLQRLFRALVLGRAPHRLTASLFNPEGDQVR